MNVCGFDKLNTEWGRMELKVQKLEEENKQLRDTVFDMGMAFEEQVHQILELKKENINYDISNGNLIQDIGIKIAYIDSQHDKIKELTDYIDFRRGIEEAQDNTVDFYSQENKDLKSENEELKKEMCYLQAYNVELTQELEEKNTKINTKQKIIAALNREIDELYNPIEEQPKEKNELYKELKNKLLQGHIDYLDEQVNRLEEENSALNHEYEVCQLKRDMYAQRLNELSAENEALKQANGELYKKTFLHRGNWS